MSHRYSLTVKIEGLHSPVIAGLAVSLQPLWSMAGISTDAAVFITAMFLGVALAQARKSPFALRIVWQRNDHGPAKRKRSKSRG